MELHMEIEMKREIKFRVWDTVTKKMLSGFHLFGEITLIGGIHAWQAEEGGAIGVKRNSLEALNDLVEMQFTGLLDKNGKEIYEGDVIGYKSYHVLKRWWSNLEDIPVIEAECAQQRENITLHKSEVRFRNGEFILDYPVVARDIASGQHLEQRRSQGNGDSESKYWDFEVIGNIYENPEWL